MLVICLYSDLKNGRKLKINAATRYGNETIATRTTTRSAAAATLSTGNPSVYLHEVGKERDGLDGLAQAHLISQDAVEVVVVQRHL